MKCQNCKVDIPAKFAAAIAKNVCPACEQSILPQKKLDAFLYLKKDLSQIKITMDIEDTLDRIAMYIVDNYKIGLRKKGEAQAEEEPIELQEKTEEETKEEIYQQVKEEREREEAQEYFPEEDREDGEDWDDEKSLVEDLKKKAQKGNQFTKKSGPVVNRVG